MLLQILGTNSKIFYDMPFLQTLLKLKDNVSCLFLQIVGRIKDKVKPIFALNYRQNKRKVNTIEAKGVGRIPLYPALSIAFSLQNTQTKAKNAPLNIGFFAIQKRVGLWGNIQ